MNAEDLASPLSYDYVCNTIFRKLSETFDKYRNVLPDIANVEAAITEVTPEDFFELTVNEIRMLKVHAEHSELVKAIFDNTRLDFLHGVDERNPAHEGKYYIDSVADNE